MKIIIVDDHQLILDGLKTVINKHFNYCEVSIATNKEELYGLLNLKQYDVLLLDVKLGKDDARDFISDIKVKFPNLRILILSSVSDSVSVQKIINTGVDGYIFKSESTTEIIKAMEAFANNEKYFSEKVKEKMKACGYKNDLFLTRREKEILNVIMQEKSIKEIASILSISEKTVEMHRSNLFVKLDVKNITGLVKKVIALGLLEEE